MDSLKRDIRGGRVEDWMVTLLLVADLPATELAARDSILAAQSRSLRERGPALHAAVAKAKVKLLRCKLHAGNFC